LPRKAFGAVAFSTRTALIAAARREWFDQVIKSGQGGEDPAGSAS